MLVFSFSSSTSATSSTNPLSINTTSRVPTNQHSPEEKTKRREFYHSPNKPHGKQNYKGVREKVKKYIGKPWFDNVQWHIIFLLIHIPFSNHVVLCNTSAFLFHHHRQPKMIRKWEREFMNHTVIIINVCPSRLLLLLLLLLLSLLGVTRRWRSIICRTISITSWHTTILLLRRHYGQESSKRCKRKKKVEYCGSMELKLEHTGEIGEKCLWNPHTSLQLR